MSFNVISAKLTGNPGDSGWAQVHEFRPEDKGKLARRGHLFAVIATKSSDLGVDSVVAGREILARFHEEYFGKTTASAFNALKDALEKVIKEFSSTWEGVEIAAASVLENVVYSAAGGGARTAVFRGGMLANLLVSTKKEVVSASGYPREEDVLICATESFFEALSEGSIKAALEGRDPRAAAESLAPTVHSVKESGNLGAVFVKFEKEGVFAGKMAGKKKATSIKTKPSPKRTTVYLIKLGNFFSKLTGSFFERRIYIRRSEENLGLRQERKLAASIGAILLALLVVSIGFGIRQKQKTESRMRYEGRLVQAQHEFEEAMGLFSLNPVRSRELFLSSRKAAYNLKDEGIDDPELEKLRGDIEQNQGYILGEYQSNSKLFIDLSILSEGFVGDDLATSAGNLFILDREGKRIVKVSIDTKKTEVVAGPAQIDEAESVLAYSDRVFITNRKGIFEIDEGRSRVLEREWEGDVLVVAYAGNLYVLEKGASDLWRYAGSGDLFGTRKAWLAPGINVDFGGAMQMAIDGSIWFLFDSGKVTKFTGGNPVSFSVSGVVPELSQPSAIYTDEGLDFVYILEKDAGRVVVVDKSGDYKAQYLSEEIGKAKDLAVSEEVGKIILFTGDKLYSVEIRHL